MMPFFLAFLALSLSTILGLFILNSLSRRRDLCPLESGAVAFGIGVGTVTWLMLILHFCGIRFAAINVLVPVLLFCLVLSTLRHPRETQTILPKADRWNWKDFLLISAISAEMFVVFLRAILLPVEAFDAVAGWGLKAKAIFLAGNIPTDFLLNQNYRYYAYHPDYPLLVPLAQSYTCLFVQEYNDFASKLIFPCFLTGCLIVLYRACRRLSLSRSESLAFTFLLGSVPYFSLQASAAYSDPILSFFFSCGAIYLYLWILMQHTGDLLISAVLLGMAGLTKNEGLVLSLICWLVLSLHLLLDKHRQKRMAYWKLWTYYGLILLVIQGPWLIYRFSLQVGNDVINRDALMASFTWMTLKRIVPILYHYQTQIFGPKNWNVVWIVFLGSLIYRFKRIFQCQVKYILLPILLTVLVYTSIYFITPRDVVWHLKTSASRVSLHFLPLIIFFLAGLYAEEKQGWAAIQLKSQPGH